MLVATPGKPNTSYKVFGAKPLEDVVKNLRSMVMEELESALAQQAPPPVQDDRSTITYIIYASKLLLQNNTFMI